MNYADIFTLPSWEPVAFSVLQTAVIFCVIIAGLKIVGRRVFVQKGPQDLVIIVLVAEACDLGLTHEDAGFWGSIASVATLLSLGYLTEKLSFIRHLLNAPPLALYENDRLRKDIMQQNMVDEGDLDEAARQQGASSYKQFSAMMLEGDGRITAIESGKE